MECWGWDSSGETLPPEGQFASVSMGESHTCGVRSDGYIRCWGQDSWGQASPPDEEFASVSVGRYHTCGIRVDGTVECWEMISSAKRLRPRDSLPPSAPAYGTPAG